MKLKLKEEPKEWRKAAWMSALGFGVMSSLLHWRRMLPMAAWLSILFCLMMVATAAAVNPRWFRGWYRFSATMGFAISKFAGYVVLAIFFFIVITPLAVLRRMVGKDSLRLRRLSNVESYWSQARQKSSLERLF